jgi:prepilin-type N-terminal cleavage/methylation domain-containing protein
MRNSGFTLVEMVAVLLILAILAGALTAGLANARNKAWRTQAREACRELCTAWNAYLLDVRKFPRDLGGASGLNATYGNLKAIVDPDENRFKRIYFEISERERDTGLLDHWGGMIKFSLDTDYDGEVDNPYPNVFEPPISKAKATSIAWSEGDPRRAQRDDNPIVIW